MAVKVTCVPAQIVLSASDEAMATLTGWLAVTFIVISLLVAVGAVAQVLLEVSTQIILSVLLSVLSVYVLVLVPTAKPFFFH